MKISKDIVLSLGLLVLVIVVPYVLTQVFGATAMKKLLPVENFQAHNPKAVREHIEFITGSGSPIPGEKKVKSAPGEVKGVYETNNSYKSLHTVSEDGGVPESTPAYMNSDLRIHPLSESDFPMPSMSSERLPIANPPVAVMDTESVSVAISPEITVPLNKMTVDSFAAGPGVYM